MVRSIRPVALATALLLTGFALADENQVVVTATRFDESDPRIPANMVVITAEDIRNTPATNVPDLLKATAGIEVRPLYGPMGIDATVDLRGFGDTADGNTLILLDGQRLNPIDSSSINWSTIPLGSIQRIEIMRGSGSVLYGDRSTGGVINIVTDKSGRPAASVAATGGSYGYRGADGRFSGAIDGTYFNLVGHYAGADGWRHNSQADQQAASGRVGHRGSSGEYFADFAAFKDSNGLPGALLSHDYQTDPTRARTPFDSQRRDGYRLRPGVSLKLSDSLSFDGEIAFEHLNYHADDVSFASTFITQHHTLSATPRLRWQQNLAGLRNETVAGLDYYGGKVDATSLGTPSVIAQGAKQNSAALYVQNVTELSNRWALTAGARQQRVQQQAQQGAYLADFGFGPTAVPGLNGSATHTRGAFDLGLVFQSDGWRAFGKYGSVFRFPNTDELFGFDPITGNPVFAGGLLPQHGTNGELGASFRAGGTVAQLSAYRLNLTDEIAFDGTTFANVNLPATRRQGLEAEIDWPATAALKVHAAYTYTDARFRKGTYDGRDIPLVARNKGAFRLASRDVGYGAYSLAATTVGNRRYSGDFANARGSLAGYTTVDLQGSWKLARWTLTGKLINAFDRRYAPFAGYSTFVNDFFYYPADARSLFISARYEVD